MAGGSERFGRADRLLRSGDFQRVMRGGRRAAGKALVLVTARRPPGLIDRTGARLGITVSRAVGGAVVRNRVKRQVREWFRRERARLPRDLDLVVIGRSAAGGLEPEVLHSELANLGGQLEEAR